jgi:hypothetical protein
MQAATVDSSLQVSIYGKTLSMVSPSQYKTCSLSPLLQISGSRFKYGSMLWPVTFAAHVLKLSLTIEKNSEERGWPVYEYEVSLGVKPCISSFGDQT